MTDVRGTDRAPRHDSVAAPLRGVYTIMPTPFHDDGRLDERSLARLTEFLIGLGVDGLTVLGFLGEAHKLSEAEQETVVKVVTHTAAGRVPVFAGASSGGVSLGVERGLRFIELGASGLMVAPLTSDSAPLLAQYRALDDALASAQPHAPIIIHDYPAATGVRLSADQIAVLNREVRAVTTVKLEDPPTGPKINALRRLGGEIGILGGLGGLYLVEELGRGADGIMTGLSFPELLVSVTKAHLSGEPAAMESARTAFYQAAALLRFEFQPGVGLAIRKEIYRRRGAVESAYVRSPGAQLDDALAEELDAVLNHVGFDLRPGD